MRRKQMKTYQLRKRLVEKNAEGGDVVSWAVAVPIDATIWQAGGAVQKMYRRMMGSVCMWKVQSPRIISSKPSTGMLILR